ncbi:MAG: hypothetical protein LBU24_02345 [Methanocalculaceae archaeon]|nr:hypothetical protein [Methanocalculaceae archaeon]
MRAGISRARLEEMLHASDKRCAGIAGKWVSLPYNCRNRSRPAVVIGKRTRSH